MAGGTSNHDWTQWMQWDGEEQHSSSCRPDPASPRDNTGTIADSHLSYPVSPSSTAHSDRQSLQPIAKALNKAGVQTNCPPTPSHSSSSPDTLYPPGPRLSGETLRSTSSSELPRLQLKRKASDEVVQVTAARTSLSHQKPTSKKRPHNVIEKRYRANLNEKIAELRQSVPSLRSTTKGSKDEDVDDEAYDCAGSAKLNKASVLTKAVEYIRHLELRNRRLDNENVSLKQRLLKLERVMALDGNNGKERAAAFTNENTVEQIAYGPDEESHQMQRAQKHPPQGMIPVPESMKRLRQNQPQEHYGAVYDEPQESKGSGLKWPAKLMIGSLAGLMVLDGLSESQESSDSTAKGLFGIPLEFMDGWWFLQSPKAFIAAFTQYCRAGGVVPLLKGFTALSILAFVVFAYLFNSKPAKVDRMEKPPSLRKVPSLASPIEVRRQAWLTSIQTLKLPHHSFFPEWFAVTVQWLKYTIRLVLGVSTYSWITGKSEEDELARIKAWDIAIDAQLAGGDSEISRSRLVLSIFASGTLPPTPARLMLSALHCRVVLWNVGHDEGLMSRISNRVAVFFANRQWRKAKRLAEELKAKGENVLPIHLAELLYHDCQEVMLDPVLQRAYNLMYDRPTDEASYGTNSLMDVVVEDHAISSPLDAIAAWWSCQKLHQALLFSLSEDQQDPTRFQAALTLALKIAPPLSAAFTRALAVEAVFVDQDRANKAQKVRSALPTTRSKASSKAPPLHAPLFIDSSMPLSACSEVSIVLHCATIMVELNSIYYSTATTGTTVSNLDESLPRIDHAVSKLYAALPSDSSTTSLLSFAPTLHVLTQVLQKGESLSSTPIYGENNLSRNVHHLASWASTTSSPNSACLPPSVMAKLAMLCKQLDEDDEQWRVKRRQSSVSDDTGYGSLGELEGN